MVVRLPRGSTRNPTPNLSSTPLVVENVDVRPCNAPVGPERFDPHVVDRKALEAAVNALPDKLKPRRRATRHNRRQVPIERAAELRSHSTLLTTQTWSPQARRKCSTNRIIAIDTRTGIQEMVRLGLEVWLPSRLAAKATMIRRLILEAVYGSGCRKT